MLLFALIAAKLFQPIFPIKLAPKSIKLITTTFFSNQGYIWCAACCALSSFLQISLTIIVSQCTYTYMKLPASLNPQVLESCYHYRTVPLVFSLHSIKTLQKHTSQLNTPGKHNCHQGCGDKARITCTMLACISTSTVVTC